MSHPGTRVASGGAAPVPAGTKIVEAIGVSAAVAMPLVSTANMLSIGRGAKPRGGFTLRGGRASRAGDGRRAPPAQYPSGRAAGLLPLHADLPKGRA